MKKNLIGLLIVSVVLSTGCKKKTTEPGGGGEGTATGKLRVGGTVTEIGSFVWVQDSLGNPITDATVKINDAVLHYEQFFSAFFDSTVKYQNGATYTLSIDAGTHGSAQATVTAPTIDSVRITNLTQNQNVLMNQPLDVTWQYYGGNNNKFVSFEFAYDEDTTRYFKYDLDGSTTSQTVPASKLNHEGNADVSVTAYNYTHIEGAELPNGMDSPPELGAVFGAGTIHTVQVHVTSDTSGGGGGGSSFWNGIFSGTVNGTEATGTWTYTPLPYPTFNADIYAYPYSENFLQLNVSFPFQQLTLTGSMGNTLTLVTTYQTADSVSGTWTLSGSANGSGTWGGRAVSR